MINPTEAVHPDGFRPHPSVLQWLQRGGDIQIGTASVLMATEWLSRKTVARHVYETTIVDPSGALCKFAIAIGFDSPVGDVWWWPVNGNSGVSAPTFKRRGLVASITSSDDTVELIDAPTDPKSAFLHGQGVTVQHAQLDFETGRLYRSRHIPGPRVMSIMAPVDAHQASGDWPYMGITFPTRTLYDARRLFYSFGNYPGTMLNPDGSFVKESQFPQAVLHDGTHFHQGAGPHWINYTNPREPYHDRAEVDAITGKRINPPDDQHFMYDNLAQAYIDNPEDEGLRWLVLGVAHRVLLQIPGKDKGTSHETPGQARGQGRVESDLSWLTIACEEMVDQIGLVGELRVRWLQRHNAQVVEAHRKIRETGVPWPEFETSEDNGRVGYAPHEIGVWFWGLDAPIPTGFGSRDLIAELDVMKDACARFCFDAIRPDGGVLKVPYKVFADGGVKNLGTSHLHFNWLAAINCKINPGEEQKLADIYALRDTIAPRFRG